jgi:hypothetical protein
MRQLLASFWICLATALPAMAESYTPIRDRSEFLSLIEGREMRLALFRIKIEVLRDGRIEGSALGWELNGTWDWKDGYFCREMNWGGSPIAPNCQLVEARGNRDIRFTVDQGAGESASFRLH